MSPQTRLLLDSRLRGNDGEVEADNRGWYSDFKATLTRLSLDQASENIRRHARQIRTMHVDYDE